MGCLLLVPVLPSESRCRILMRRDLQRLRKIINCYLGTNIPLMPTAETRDGYAMAQVL